tara:strand:- start:2754 stop:3038 length:285 start_codon:yes stop_codon:yes gene_type:complete
MVELKDNIKKNIDNFLYCIDTELKKIKNICDDAFIHELIALDHIDTNNVNKNIKEILDNLNKILNILNISQNCNNDLPYLMLPPPVELVNISSE